MRRLLLLLLVPVLLGLSWFLLPPPRPAPAPGRVLPGGAVVAYSKGYRVSFYGIERLHPFDIGKPGKIARHLQAQGLVPEDGFLVPGEVDPDLLASVHDPAYLARLREARYLGQALEVGIPGFLPSSGIERRVLGPFRRQVQGTVLAARGALEHGLGINLGGGFHHARADMGHGFCVYSDVAVAIADLRRRGFTGTVLVVDTDAHQGDGTHSFFAEDPRVFSLSLQQEGIFPQPRLQGDLDLDLPAGTGDSAYLSALEGALASAPQAPDLLIHVAGSDVLSDDPLAGLALSPAGLMERDLFVLRWARERHIPLLHLLAGGYGPSSAEAQGQSVAAMLREVRE